MTRLDALIERVVEGYRSVFMVTSVVAIVLTVAQQNWLGLIFLIPILIGSYFIGLWLTGQILAMFIDRDLLRDGIQINRIQILNEKLESGELTVDDPKLAKEMKRAGLRPLSLITEKGPIFGRQFDANLHEWIDAKEGDADVGRYVYKGQAEFDTDGTVFIQDQSEKSLYLVLDGILYERVMETST